MSERRDLIELLNDLLSRRAETRNCEYKAATPWPAKGNSRSGLIKDILAFSNTADGGWIVFGVTDGDYVPVGLTAEQVESFDQSRIHEALLAHASPVPIFELHKLNTSGHAFVLIHVHEFGEVPAICTRDVQLEKDPRDPRSELVLRNGAIYVRSAGAQSVEVRDEGTMRELIGRAVRRTRETFLTQLDRVLAGRVPPVPTRAGLYDRAIADYLESVTGSAAMSDAGHWVVTVQPFPANARRIPVEQLLKRISDSAVNLRGWPMPDLGTIERFDDAIESSTDWGQHHERWRAQCSGLFVHAFRLASDENPDYKGDLLLRDLLYTMSEIMQFAKRLHGDDATVESLMVTAELFGLQGRKLVDGPNVYAPYRQATFKRAESLERSVLSSTADQMSLEWTQELLFAMGYTGDRAMLEERQSEFLSGVFVGRH